MIPNTLVPINPSFPRPGTVVSTSRLLYRHVGIITDRILDGQPTVISNSSRRGMVVEESMKEFLNGGDFRIDGYFGSLPSDVVLYRARAKLGSGYSVLGWNCEHFARDAHGLKPESPQLTVAVSLSLLFLVASRL